MSSPHLQRRPLLAAAATVKPSAGRDKARFLGNVFRAIAGDRQSDLVALLRQPAAASWVRGGFQADSGGVNSASLAEVCVEMGNLAALRAVLEARIPSLTLDDCCTVEMASGSFTVTTPFDLPEAAMKRLDVQGLALALEFAPGHESFTRFSDQHCGTLHYGALVAALQFAERDAVAAAVKCCALLIQHADVAPCSSDVWLEEGLRRLFIVGRYDERGNEDLVLPLFRQYVAAGFFDVDAPVSSIDQPLRPGVATAKHAPPLTCAILVGNASLAGDLVDAGCDLDAARGGYSDVLALAAAQIGNNGRAGETFADVSEALMRRRLGQRLDEPAGAFVDQAVPVRAPRARSV